MRTRSISAASALHARPGQKRKTLLKRIWMKKWCYLIILPGMVYFLLFKYVPMYGIQLAFKEFDMVAGISASPWVGWSNFELLFRDREFFLALKNTLIFAVFTGPLGYLLSFFASWCINEMSRPVKAVLTFIFYMPTISGMTYTIWQLIFSGDMYGYLNSALLRLGIIDDPIQWLTTEQYILPIIILVQLWLSFGTGFLTMVAGFSTIDRQYYEAAAIDGCGYLRYVIRCIVPLAQPAMVSMGMLSMIGVWNDIVSSTIYLTSESNYNITRGLFVFTGQYSNDWTLTAAGLLVVAAPLILIYIFGQRYIVDGVMAGGLKG